MAMSFSELGHFAALWQVPLEHTASDLSGHSRSWEMLHGYGSYMHW
jgi:hypothetical protein